MIINTIYASYQGETNAFGIGTPVIFIRTGGCHLRCYLKTLGSLCDTPEALERGSGENMSTDEIIEKVESISQSLGGIKLICLTGGDPLWRASHEIHDLLTGLTDKKYKISVETSGTIDPTSYMYLDDVSWVLDYKLKSAGVKQKFVFSCLPNLVEEDIIKFVVHDLEDYNEFLEVIMPLLNTTKAKIAIGLFWGSSKISYSELINLLSTDKLLGRVLINMQVHKMATFYDNHLLEASQVKIPTEI